MHIFKNHFNIPLVTCTIVVNLAICRVVSSRYRGPFRTGDAPSPPTMRMSTERNQAHGSIL